MYEPPRQDERPGCRETWVITRAVFAVLLPVLLAIMGVLGAAVAAFVLFAVHPALALAPVGLLAGAVYLFARWEQGQPRPPDA